MDWEERVLFLPPANRGFRIASAKGAALRKAILVARQIGTQCVFLSSSSAKLELTNPTPGSRRSAFFRISS